VDLSRPSLFSAALFAAHRLWPVSSRPLVSDARGTKYPGLEQHYALQRDESRLRPTRSVRRASGFGLTAQRKPKSLNTRIDANPQGAFGQFASDISLIVLPAAVPASDYSRHTPYYGGVSQISGSPPAENGKEGEHTRLVVWRWSEDGRSATTNPGSSEFSPNRDARLGV